MPAVGGDGYAGWAAELRVVVMEGDVVGSEVDAADVVFARKAVGEEGEGGVGRDGHAKWEFDPFFWVREGDLVGAEVDVTNAFTAVCNEGEGGVGGDVYAGWKTEPFVGACGCVGVGVDVFDGAPIADEEEGVVGA